jgi:small subunit ribosomal protein S7e
MSDAKKDAKADGGKDNKKENKKQQAPKKTEGDAKKAAPAGDNKKGGERANKKSAAPAKAAPAPAPAAPSTAAATTAPAPAKDTSAKEAAPAAAAPAHKDTAHKDTAHKDAKSHTAAPAHAAPHSAEHKAAQEKAPHMKKIVKAKGEKATEVELSVARALLELEVSAKEIAADLADLYFTAAKEVDVAGKKSVVVFVPFKQHGKFKKLQGRLVRELEKKLGKLVVIIAQRTILSQNYKRKTGQLRPRSRTLTAVHNAILDDLVYPTLIVGKRMRVKADGSRLIKVFLDPKDVKEVDTKLKTFQSVYKKLTNKNVEFSFPSADD